MSNDSNYLVRVSLKGRGFVRINEDSEIYTIWIYV